MIRIFSVGIRSIPSLEAFLGTSIGFGLASESGQALEAVAGWGLRSSANRAIRFARKMRLPYLALEDGFLRSVGSGRDEPPLSMVIDDRGIYYDAGRESRLENLIKEPLALAQETRADALVAAWRAGRVSKYNHHRELVREPVHAIHADWRAPVPDRTVETILQGRYVLVVDQVKGDASIRYGQASAESFQRMLDAAIAENPQCTIVVKTHPDVCAGIKRGHLVRKNLQSLPGVMVLDGGVHPVGLVEHAEAVYVVTSQLGFEGLLWGKPVHTFGMPFYAGWGLTLDALPAPCRRQPVSLQQLVHAALIEYPRYVDPETGKRCEVEDVLRYLSLQRKMQERFPQALYAVGMPWYKRPTIRAFFHGSQVHFRQHPGPAEAGEAVAVWGTGDQVLRTGPSRGEEGPVIHVEDGFLRSVGLGADLVRPLSWVLDRRGIYYDATRPSDLEALLNTTVFDHELLTRARLLRHRIVAEGLTKYNVGQRERSLPDRVMLACNESGRRTILVPGQVETDASIRYGTSAIRSNRELLQAVRAANPAACIVYKPHPDVVSGLRAPGKGERDSASLCDEVITNVSVHELLRQVDEVHVLTSLTGFEALLRQKPVTTYGQPFYAGWGLTRDRHLEPAVAHRRKRILTLDELVAAVLILYPTYVSRTTGHFTTPERALDELVSWRDHAARNRSLIRPLHWLLRLKGALL